MSLIGIEPGTMCHRCHIHLATVQAADSVMDAVHGMLYEWCECCYFKDAIRKAKEAAERLPELTEQLDTACLDQPAPDTDALILENDKLRTEMMRMWEMAHHNFCLNKAGQEWPHPVGQHCYWPKPDLLR